MLGRIGQALVRRSQSSYDTGYNFGNYGYGLLHGGIVNETTGLGTSADKSQGSFWVPTRNLSRYELETIREESSAAAKFTNILPDDMTLRWRLFQGQDDGMVKAMTKAEQRHQVVSKLARVMKAARLYGTGLMILVTREDDLSMPLRLEAIREGDLANLLVLDRWDATVLERNRDPYNPERVELYHITPSEYQSMVVHSSRVLRFDGSTSLSDSGFTNYDRDWGVSELIPILTSIYQDAAAVGGVSHLTQELSIPVVNVSGLREAIAGGMGNPNGQSVEQIGRRIKSFMSNWNMLMLDRKESVSRLTANLSGVSQVLDLFQSRLAAAADIPKTRWMGLSPVGFSTGDSDLHNYAVRIGALQVRMLTDPLETLDAVLARDAGIRGEVPEYEWLPLLNLSEKDKAEAEKIKMEAVALAIDKTVIVEEEGREIMSGGEVFGNLEPRDDLGAKAEMEAEVEAMKEELAQAKKTMPAAEMPPETDDE